MEKRINLAGRAARFAARADYPKTCLEKRPEERDYTVIIHASESRAMQAIHASESRANDALEKKLRKLHMAAMVERYWSKPSVEALDQIFGEQQWRDSRGATAKDIDKIGKEIFAEKC